MVEVEWAKPAFDTLAGLPHNKAFEIIALTDRLAAFPEMGKGLRAKEDAYRVLVVGRSFRLVYRYNKSKNSVLMLALQSTPIPAPGLAKLRTIERRDGA